MKNPKIPYTILRGALPLHTITYLSPGHINLSMPNEPVVGAPFRYIHFTMLRSILTIGLYISISYYSLCLREYETLIRTKCVWDVCPTFNIRRIFTLLWYNFSWELRALMTEVNLKNRGRRIFSKWKILSKQKINQAPHPPIQGSPNGCTSLLLKIKQLSSTTVEESNATLHTHLII
jgi:hypothetical protein